MAKNQQINMYTHHNIYTAKSAQKTYGRTLNVYFSTPEHGINKNTGILLLIAGFGAHANSNVYKKMRENFSDNNNLVTVQCDYFGYQFMQGVQLPPKTISQMKDCMKGYFSESDLNIIFSENSFSEKDFRKISLNNNLRIKLDIPIPINETLNNFADMSLLQAIDNINAVLNTINIIFKNDLSINTKKIIIYGHSQGAYLGYLCNAFCPQLFSLLIDNSAWLYPKYINEGRLFSTQYGQISMNFIFDYFIKANINNLKYLSDKELLYLPNIYNQFSNNCQILSYHGTMDTLAPYRDKDTFSKNIKNLYFNEISPDEIDGKIFKNATHGLGADFIKFFYNAMNDRRISFEQSDILDFVEAVDLSTNKTKFIISYENIFPHIMA